MASQDIFLFPWQPSRAVVANRAWVYVNGNTYKCVGSGTTAASGGPSGTGTGITDGSATWDFVVAGQNIIVPSDWDNANNFIEGIGEGGSGGAFTGAFRGGGGGGEWRRSNGITLTPSATVAFTLGTGGAGTDTTFNSTTLVAKRGGNGGAAAGAGGTGGTGTYHNNGGAGGLSSGGYSGGGGGGAGGPTNPGATGGQGSGGNGGTGGGGSDGGSAGNPPSGNSGGAGGGNALGAGGGAGGVGSNDRGQPGSNGGGGGGAAVGGGTTDGISGAGGNGITLGLGFGSGGGGGGLGLYNQGSAGAGGLFGGGGGATNRNGGGTPGTGGAGLLHFSWGVVVPPPDLAASVYRVRAGGNNLNGGGFNATAVSAGTDYSQQDAAQATGTHGVCTGDSIFTDATANAFTSAMVGNAIKLPGGSGFTAGVYYVSEYISASQVGLDRSPGTGTGQSWRLGGAWSDLANLDVSVGILTAGNVAWLRGAGSQNPSSADYTQSGFITPPVGSAAEGWVKILGENGRPLVSVNGNLFFLTGGGSNPAPYLWLENLCVKATGTNNAGAGIVGTSSSTVAETCTVVNCRFDQNGNDITALRISGTVIGTEIYDSTGGSGGGSPAILTIQEGIKITGCNIHNCKGPGIDASSRLGTFIDNNIIAFNHGYGVFLRNNGAGGGSDNSAMALVNNTIDGNTTNGIECAAGTVLQYWTIVANLITNNTTAGLNLTAGATAANNRLRGIFARNWYFGNGAVTANVSIGSTDVSGTDPQYVSQSTQNYKCGAAVNAGGFPQAVFRQAIAGKTATRTYPAPGAVQQQDQS